MSKEQEFLNDIASKDSCGFLEGVSNWNNHRPLLYLALELTKQEGTQDVLELGCGSGSTPYLHCYCENTNRELTSFDNNQEWVDKFLGFLSDTHKFTSSDVPVLPESVSVCLVDHAPGEQRYLDVKTLADKASILVIHDSEPEATGYMMDRIWHLFKYRINVKTSGAWATMVSNVYDVTKYDGCLIKDFLLEV